jgi:DNA-binding transcriptional regulator YbjK
VPPPNEERRARLADAAIALLAAAGGHGVTHRAVDTRAGLPAGTASNYFRSREALLLAAAERAIELHQADMTRAERRPARPGDPIEQAIELIADSLLEASTVHRDRYRALFELRMESLRRPVLAKALEGLQEQGERFTVAHHAALRLAIDPAAVPLLMALYGGVLFTLVTAPDGTAVDAAVTRHLAAGVVHGALRR